MLSPTVKDILEENQDSIPMETLNIEQIKELLPHRYPMLLVDRIEDVVAGESCVGIKSVTMNEWYFVGHFPAKPVMPGVLIVEAMAQTAGALVAYSMNMAEKEKLVYFMSIEEARFRKPVVPGDQVQLRVQKQRQRGNVWKFNGEAYVNDTLVAEASFTAMISDEG